MGTEISDQAIAITSIITSIMGMSGPIYVFVKYFKTLKELKTIGFKMIFNIQIGDFLIPFSKIPYFIIFLAYPTF